MKKLMTFALCFAAVGSMSAQKANVDAAKKLSGKPDKIEEARSLIQQAMENPETANDAQTYFIAGKIEFDAFDKDLTNSMINPASVDNVKMGQNLINGYHNFVKALPLAAVPNEKGKVDTKTPKSIVSTLKGHANDYFKIRDMSGKGLDNRTMAQKAGIPPFAVSRNVTQAKGFSVAQLKQALRYGVELEEALKTGRMDDRMAVELFIMKYSAK